MHQSHYHHFNCYHYYEELELAAARACAALLYCGHSSFKNMSVKSPHIFLWLDQLIECASAEAKMYAACTYALPNEISLLALNVCTQLLDSQLYLIVNSGSNKQPSANTPLVNMINFDSSGVISTSALFDKMIDKCYVCTEPATTDLCFMAVAKVYTDYLNINLKQRQRKSNFDSNYMTAILTLCLLNIGSQRVNIHETSVLLLRAINNRFLTEDEDEIIAESSANLDEKKSTHPILLQAAADSRHHVDADIINSLVIYSKSQLFIAEYLARKNPDLTMHVFLELTSRFEKCQSHTLRRQILAVLVPWLYNVQLVDSHVVVESPGDNQSSRTNSLGFNITHAGSATCTHLVLNNLFYLTCRYGAEFNAELELLWAVLALTWPESNVKIIVRHLYLMCSLSTYDMLAHSKRVVAYLTRSSSTASRVVHELCAELECMDSLRSVLECVDRVPYYAYTRPAYAPSMVYSPAAVATAAAATTAGYAKGRASKERSVIKIFF
jgi:hypothetical protein